MADDTKFTQADIDKAVTAAVAKVQDSIDALEAKNSELIADVRKAKQAARSASEIKPEDLAAAEERADKAEAKAKELEGSVKTLTKERDTAVKSLETEQGAGRNYALEAEINGAIAAAGVVPALVPALTAMVKQQAKAELVDGKYVVNIGDKAAKEYISAFMASDEGKHFKSATMNSGGGAGGGGGSGGGKSLDQSSVDAMKPKERASFFAEGGTIANAA